MNAMRSTHGRLALPIFAFGAACVLLVPIGRAQTSRPPQFRSSVDLVHLDVSVLDGHRRPVLGLTADDFTVLEDGKPQAVAAFSAVHLPDPPPATTSWLREIAPDVRRNTEVVDRRLVVIVMDDAMIPFDPPMIRSAREIGRLTVERLGPHDLAAVVFTRDNRNAQEFTSDRARLLKAVASFEFGGRTIGQPPDAPELGVSEVAAFEASVGTLSRVAAVLAEVPQRRKALVYVTVGLPVDAAAAAEVSIIGAGVGGDREVAAAFRQVLVRLSEAYRNAQRSNVNVYTVSPAGVGGMEQYVQSQRFLGRSVPDYETHANYFDFLVGVAENTGGRAFPDRNEFESAITAVFQENGSYYLLGYQPPNPALDGRHRRIEVRVHRPGLAVRTRSGYYNAKAQAEEAKAAAPLTAALGGLLPKADVPLDVTAMPFAISGRAETGVVIVLTVHEDLPVRTARTTEEVDLQITAFSQDGQPRGSESLKTRVTLRPGPAGPAEYEVLSRVTLRPGRYQLRLSARTGARTGSVYYDLDVPDFGATPVSLSGVAFSSDSKPVSSSADPIRQLLPIVPTARRVFAATDRVTVFARVYQGGRDPVAPTTVTARITDASGAQRMNRSQLLTASEISGGLPGRPPFAAAAGNVPSSDRSVEFRMDLPLGGLPPGEYLFTLEATTPRGQARRDVRFTLK
jgi:VWFA-related protein